MSFWRNYYHLTWCTKDCIPLIHADIEQQLYRYLIKKAAEQDVFIYEINGIEDHIHIVASIPPKHCVADVVKNLKGASSHYINQVFQPEQRFRWHRGYGCLTIGDKQLSIAENYVRNQKTHHANQTINGWLERYAEGDEGPVVVEPCEDDQMKFVREETGIYDVLGDSPF